MEFSEQWFREWINPTVDTDSLCDQMTKLGLEVEKVVKISNVCTNLIVGEVVKRSKNFFSIEFLLIKVNIGNNKFITVASRYFDVVKGMKVIIATENSKLFNDKFLNLIRSRSLECEGIICFCEDIGIINFKKNTIILPLSCEVGVDVNKCLSLDDNIIKISSTPNRSDALSILGIARDIAVLNNLSSPRLKKYLNSVDNFQKTEILIDASDVCLRFFGRIISNVNVNKNTPFWILEKLKRSSIEPSNIIANIINYVLIEVGQPLYIINFDSILKKIVIRRSYKGETILVNKNKNLVIENNSIVITDEEKVLALGGHIYSCVSEVNLKSNNLFMGCASYNNLDIFKKYHHYGCKNFFTERYDRGIDFSIQPEALEYATYLITKFCGGRVSNVIGKVDFKKKFSQKFIKLFRKKLYEITGCVISDESVSCYLIKLGFKIILNKGCEYWLVQPPSWRFDINIEEDVISELFRMYGYDKVPIFPMSTCYNVPCNDESDTLLNRIKLFLVDRGYNEIITYGFVNPDLQKLLFPDIPLLCLSNPISREMSSMRVSLWIGLLSIVSYNQNRQEKKLRFFESGLCFMKDPKERLGIKQSMYLSGILSGRINDLHWDVIDRKADFYDAKGDVESILDLLGKLNLVKFKSFKVPGLHPNQSIAIYFKEKMVGMIGTINPYLEKRLSLKDRTIVFELIWDDIASLNSTCFKKISEYPRSIRDISIIVDETIAVGDIILELQNSFFKNIVDIILFDVFRGSNIGIGKKSLAFQLVLENKEKTFTEEEISKILKRCIATLESKFNAVLRKSVAQ
ncbi:MAG: phenylalanine--tRNA ligase subunit beta [Buchnera aphidicola (Schlechtendalia chinensis)]